MNMLEGLARKGLTAADNFCAALSPGPRGEGSLITVLFHSIYRSHTQIGDARLAPNQHTTVEDLRRVIGVMLDSGYEAVSPAQVDAGLKPHGKYLMITFDDGYFNNTLALDVLAQFHAPAIFFISSDHVLARKGFWWDALNRELARLGVSEDVRKSEIDKLKTWSSRRIEAWLHERFGGGVLEPRSDLDRPFTPDELADFARNPWVHLGNHTCDHAILTRCTPREIARQIDGCQKALEDMVGYAPIAIAYPNGDYSRAAVDGARAAGLRIGLTVRPCQTRLPLDDEKSRMTLGRFLVLGGQDPRSQCRKFSSGFIPSNMVKTLMMSGY